MLGRRSDRRVVGEDPLQELDVAEAEPPDQLLDDGPGGVVVLAVAVVGVHLAGLHDALPCVAEVDRVLDSEGGRAAGHDRAAAAAPDPDLDDRARHAGAARSTTSRAHSSARRRRGCSSSPPERRAGTPRRPARGRRRRSGKPSRGHPSERPRAARRAAPPPSPSSSRSPEAGGRSTYRRTSDFRSEGAAERRRPRWVAAMRPVQQQREDEELRAADHEASPVSARWFLSVSAVLERAGRCRSS